MIAQYKSLRFSVMNPCSGTLFRNSNEDDPLPTCQDCGNRVKSSCMFEVMVEKHFAAAHHLLNYRGKCENPHGHNYVVQVFAKKDTLDKANVAFDFTILKSELGQIVDDLDHTDLNEFPDFNGESPSAEYIARYVYQRIKKNVPEITRACVYETPTQRACYLE